MGLGTLKLLASARLPRLVGLGTAITIVAIGIDPFMQQVIHFDFQPNLYGDQYGNPNGVNTISCVGRAQFYDGGLSVLDFKMSNCMAPFSILEIDADLNGQIVHCSVGQTSG